ncbi:Uncharacterized tRNA/rRNA methyltransferase YsgA [Chlamydiales bacterium SCGC AG-110-P3]|nr:Uncharacterized tRNA/rRNA methyltransferase YsgA [Chlamydiales bacterium SCGC AG-110-P3]
MIQQITSVQHPLVKQLVRLRDRRSERYSQQLILIEGMNMLKEICEEQPITHLLTTDVSLLPVSLHTDSVIAVSESVMRKISACETPNGAIAVVSMPAIEADALFSIEPQRLVILDGIADPGNLGTILRTAGALGWDGVYCIDGCCDPFNPKAIRAAKGATFRLPLALGDRETLARYLSSYTVLTADLDGEDVSAYSHQQKVALVLSSEAHGVQEPFPDARRITIQMHGEMESLNVAAAGAILMNALHGKING